MKKINWKNKSQGYSTPVTANNLNLMQDYAEEEVNKKIDKEEVKNDINNLKVELEKQITKNKEDIDKIINDYQEKEEELLFAKLKKQDYPSAYVNTKNTLKNGNIYFVIFPNEKYSESNAKFSVDNGETEYFIVDRKIGVQWDSIKGKAKILHFNGLEFEIINTNRRFFEIFTFEEGTAQGNIGVQKNKQTAPFNFFEIIDKKIKVIPKKIKIKISGQIFVDKHARTDAGYIWARVYKNGERLTSGITSGYGEYSTAQIPETYCELDKNDTLSVALNNSKDILGTIRYGSGYSFLTIEILESIEN